MLDATATKPNTIHRAAARLGVSRPTIYRLINEGRLRTYRIGRAHRVTDAAVDECIQELERVNTVLRRVA